MDKKSMDLVVRHNGGAEITGIWQTLFPLLPRGIAKRLEVNGVMMPG